MIASLLKIAAQRAKTAPNKKLIEQVQRLQGHYQKAFVAANVTWTREAARAAWNRQQSDHAGKHRAGQEITRAYSLDDLAHDYETRQESAKLAMAQASCDAVEPAAELRKWFIGELEPMLKEMERAEIEDHASWGLAWKPSIKIIELRVVLDWSHANVPAGAAGWSPAGMVPFLTLS